jgi:imidazolonepropionase-like amidohydrolase
MRSAAPTVLRGARIIVGDGSTVLEDGAVALDGGTIVAVGPSSSVTVPTGATELDVSGKTIMPAIVNPHGHIGYLKGSVADKENYSRENVLDHLRRLAYYGISTFQSLGTDRDGTEIAIRDEQRAGTLDDPRLATLLTAGRGIVAPTPGKPNGGPFFATDVIWEVTTPDEARETVRKIAATNPDIVKFWVDDRWGSRAKLGPEVYAAIIEEAHRLGHRVVAHIFELEDAKGVVRAGVDGIAHMVREPGPDEELLEMMVAGDVFGFTSMGIQRGDVGGTAWLDDPSFTESLDPEAIEGVRQLLVQVRAALGDGLDASYAILEAGLRAYVAAGVRTVLSADSGLHTQLIGIAEHRELEAMVTAGMPSLEAIRAATDLPAELLGLHDRGTVSVGKRADLLVLDANPVDDITNTRRISDVYLAGHRLDRGSMRVGWSTTGATGGGGVAPDAPIPRQGSCPC